MKTYLIYFLIIELACFTSHAQQVVSSSGNYYNNYSGSISYTVGEPIIETFSEENYILTQGFQQSNLIVTAINELPGLNFEISVYPNPATEIVKLKIGKESSARMQYMLYDLNGKLLLQNKLAGIETEIPFNDFSPSEYLLIVFDQDKEVMSFKIVKIW
jgi:hypothetical protein